MATARPADRAISNASADWAFAASGRLADRCFTRPSDRAEDRTASP